MNEILDKISSYNIFNYLLPGASFAFIGQQITPYQFTPSDTITAGFTYYFYGLLISRIGSLVVEPVAKRLGVVVFADYKLFVAASRTDPKLEVLSEQNNTYRSLISMIGCLFGLNIYAGMVAHYPALAAPAPYALAVAVLVLLTLSYRKQTAYITKCIGIISDK